MNRLGLRAAAKELGVSHAGLKKAADEGRVTRGTDRLFDVEEARKQLAGKSHPIKAKSARAQQAKPEVDETLVELDLNRIVTARERVKLEKDQLNLAKQKGLLVDKEAVNAFVAGQIMKAREILLQIGPRTRDNLAKIDDPIECERLVMGEINRALRELALYP
jgi:hypothetical protein